MMTKRLIVDNDEASALAHELAGRRGISLEEAVVSSLRSALQAVPPKTPPAGPVRIPTLEDMTPDQRADYDALGRLVEEARHSFKPGATSDHSDMYDEHGLPI